MTPTGDTTSTTTSTVQTGTPVYSQSTGPPSQDTIGGAASPSDAGGGANAGSGSGGSGTPNATDASSTDPSSTGSPTNSTGPPGGGTSGSSTDPSADPNLPGDTTVTTTESTTNETSGGTSPGSGGGKDTVGVVVSTSDPGTTGTSSNTDAPSGSNAGAADGQGSANSTDPSGNPPTSSNTQSAQSNATTHQSGATNGNVTVRVGQGGNAGTVTQGNEATSSASSSATGNLPETGSGASATAGATTTQNSPANTNVAVRVGSPGDIAAIGQQNDAQAGATAVGSTDASGTGGGGTATADATQNSPTNVNVIVRVASPGNNAGVSQANTVGATAGPYDSNTSGPKPDSTSPAATDQSVTTSSQSGVDNTGSVNQQLLQAQDGLGPDIVAGADAADAVPASSTGKATATQTGAQNINVSIRVASPGSDGTVNQTNGASATGTSPDFAIVNSDGGSNLNVAIALPGSANGAPGEQWMWNWTWAGNGTPPAGSTSDALAPTTGAVWNWTWTPPATGTSPAVVPAAPAAPTPGTFTWTWTWTLPGGQQWTLTQQQACTCSWLWSWSWDWNTGLPKTSAPAPAAAAADAGGTPTDGSVPSTDPSSADTGPVDQSNSVDSSAYAGVDLTYAGLLASGAQGVTDPTVGSQVDEPGQAFVNAQNATAVAEADQFNPRNYNSVWGVPVASVTQANTLDADAAAAAWAGLDQELIQLQDGNSAGLNSTNGLYQWLGAQQTTTNQQTIGAQAQAAQTDALNMNVVSAPQPNQAAVGAVAQANEATASAVATAEADLVQQLAQIEEAVDGGVEIIAGLQFIGVIQNENVGAAVSQLMTRNVNNLLVPAGSRATNPTVRQRNIVSANSASDNWVDVTSIGFQYEGGGADVEVTDATMENDVIQRANSYSPAGQSGLFNYAGWLGVEPPLPSDSGGGDNGDQGGGGGGTDGSGGGGPSVPVSPVLVPATLNATFIPYSSGGSKKIAGPIPRTEARPRPASTNGAPFTPPLAVPPVSSGGTSSIVVTPSSAGAPSPATGASPRFTSIPRLALPAPGISEAAPSSGLCSSCSQPSPFRSDHEASFGAVAPPANPWEPVPLGNSQLSGSGTSGSAPFSGGGQTLLAFGPYKLAAPNGLGPRMSSPVLGRPVVFLDPFERPG